jgi:3-hydroxyacyl-CoA dehydrogenase
MAELATLTKQGRVGVITLDNPPVNVLSHALRVALRDAIDAAVLDTSIEAILLCCAGRTFVAGADIREFDGPAGSPDVNEIIEWVGACPKPVTAAIHGTALGGGVELALACQFRVAVADAQLGFPEVNLGILPGAGGTQRLPRLIGVRAALELIVGGSSIGATKALELGLVDEILSSDVPASAVEFVERKLREARRVTKISERQVAALEPGLFEAFEQEIAHKARGFVAPFACINAVRAACEHPFQEGLRYERRLFLELVNSPESKAQRHAFFGEREVSRSPRIPREVRPKDVRSIAIVGGDEPALHVAKRFADRRMAVTLFVSSQNDARVVAGALGATIRESTNAADVTDAELVVFAVSGPALEASLAELDALCTADVVFAIVSAVNVRELAARTQHPERVLGLNFEGPSLMEVVATAVTSPQASATAMGLSKTLRKVAVLEQADEGSAAQRLRNVCLTEAERLAEQGVSASEVEFALSQLGTFRLDARPARGASVNDTQASQPALVERCVAVLANEGARLLDEGVLTRPLEVDMVAIHGHGFPLYWGGPLFRADQIGVRVIYDRLSDTSGGAAARPAALLEKLAREGGGFYQ